LKIKSKKGKADLSIVIPLFNEAESLRILYDEIRQICESRDLSFEILFVDDGSTDNSYEVLEKCHREDSRVRVIQFRRNFGKAEALSAGFSVARGERIITMDADLQDDPSEIPALMAKLDEGYDLISGWKKSRKDPFSKRIPSFFWNGMTSWITGVRLHDFNCGLKIYRREVIESVDVYGELHRYIPALADWEGFRIGEMPVNHRARRFGKSKYGVSRFFKGILDLMTVMFLSRYTRRPLHLFGMLGFLFGFFGIAITGTLLILRISKTIYLSNRPLLFLGVLFLLLGMQLFSIGLLGEMITRSHISGRGYAIRQFLGE
jgi:glycosyltransferase involved in cell wall biosynthesis